MRINDGVYITAPNLPQGKRAMSTTEAERLRTLATRVGSLTGTIKLAIAALETGYQPETVAGLLRKVIGQEVEPAKGRVA